MALMGAQFRSCVPALATAIAATMLFAGSAQALVIELKDVAADRVERQRAAASGALPLPNTPNVAEFHDRLRDKGLKLAAPIIIRVFKAESELEIWKEKDNEFVLFATYPICHWSGSTGPKLRDGDKQAPEGYYTVGRHQTRHQGRWPKSLNIGFPNILDQSLARTGSDILIHGGCSSVGCFAMTNPVMDEIQTLTEAAIDSGEDHVPVQVYPFRMTDDNMKANAASPWLNFWQNLKEGYDTFEKSRKPVAVSVCEGRYAFETVDRVHAAGQLKACAPVMSGLQEQNDWLSDVPPPDPVRPDPSNAENNSFPKLHLPWPLATAEDNPPG
jgi:murein L,D-transpeptidase YafK